ncbi:MAG: FG-GAP-like repeat-containing protein [Candidatus Glassbacteria bacterium]
MNTSRIVLLSQLIVMAFACTVLAGPGMIKRFQVGDEPWYLAIGDFNEDSHQDVVTANSSDGTIMVLLGNGYADFPDTASYYSGISPRVLAIGDFNEDSHQDVVVLHSGITSMAAGSPQNDDIAFFYGYGDGSFSTPFYRTVGDYPAGVVIGDFNEDGHQDLAITHYRSHNVIILTGNGNGTFNTEQNILTIGGPRAIVKGDFNEDSHQDLAVALRTANSMILLEGDGSGTFTVIDTTYELFQYPRAMVVADFNEDGHEDIAAACRANNRAAIYMGLGTGVFSGPQYYDVGGYPRSIAAVDLDEDGRVDVATGNFNSNDLTFLMGDGEGTMIRWLDKYIGSSPRMLDMGDFDEDGHTDLAVVNSGSDELALLLGSAAFIEPVMISPEDSSWTFVDPTFVWDAVPGAKYFQVLVSDTLYNFSWSKIVHGQTSVTYDGSVPLIGPKVYRWQVKQNTGGTFWNYTEPWFFLRRFIQSSIDAPDPKVPYNNSDVMLPELFSWDGVKEAYRYFLTIHSDTTFNDTIWSGITDSELMIVPDISGSMMFDSLYYWAITAYDSSGNPGLPSDMFRFTLRASITSPEAPVLLAPIQSDTVEESPVSLYWSWPPGATRFALDYSVDETFPPDPSKTWELDDLTDSTIVIALPPASEDIFWYVTASNSAGESSPSLTGSFTYLVADSTPLSSVEIIRPEQGREYPFGIEINALALITGSYTGAVQGFWRLDGDSIASFSLELTDTTGLEIISPPINPDGEGDHSLQVAIVYPDSIASDTVRFSILPESVGAPEAILLAISPQSIQTNGNEVATAEAFVVDGQGEVVYSDSGRLVAFFALGEVVFPDSNHSYTEGGKATITLTSTDMADSDIIVFATSESLQSGYAPMATFEGDVLNDLTPLLAHIDKLSNLVLDIYDPPMDLSVTSYDQSAVNAFLQERIVGVEEPSEPDKSAMRRLLYLERALCHGYHHEYDMLFPDPRVEPAEGALRMSDDLVMLVWESSLLATEALRASSHLIALSRGDSALKSLVRVKAAKEGLSVFEDLCISVVSQLGLHPARSDLLGAITRSFRSSFAVLDTVDDLRVGIQNSSITSEITRDVIEKVIEDAQASLDTAAAWAYRHNFSGSDSLGEILTEELNGVTDALTYTSNEDFKYYHTLGDPLLPLENLSNLRPLYDKEIISRNSFVTLKSSLESTFMPERWQIFRRMADISIASLIEVGYGHTSLALLRAFGMVDSSTVENQERAREALTEYRSELIAPHAQATEANVSLWQEILDRLASRTSTYEEKARELMEAIAAKDTLLLPDLFFDLIMFDDTLSLDLDMSLSPAGAVYPYGITGIPGFGDNYDVLRNLHTDTRFYRLMFILQIYEYLLRPDLYTSGLMAIDFGHKAIDSIRKYRETSIDFITSLFTSRAYPLVFITDIDLPDSIHVDGIDTVEVSLSNIGAGIAQDVYVKIFPSPGVFVTGDDSIHLGDMTSGSSSKALFRIKAVRAYIPESVKVGTVFAIPFCSNGLGYAGFAFTGLNDSGGVAFIPGPLGKESSDSLVSVGLFQPLGGELIAGNSEYEILWQTYGTGVDHIAILLSSDGGYSYPDTIIEWTENDGSYTWTVPLLNTSMARVRVVALSEGGVELGSAESPGNFTIDSTAPIVDIIFPDGGETLFVSLEYDLEWATSDSFPPRTGIISPKDRQVVSNEKVASIRQRNSSVKFTTPAKVTKLADRNLVSHRKASGERAHDFRSSVPGNQGRERLLADRFRLRDSPDRFFPGSLPNTVSLFYSTDSGQTWRVIAVDEPDDSLYTWIVPNRPSQNCRIGITARDEAGNQGFAMSDSDFVITTLISAATGSRNDGVMLRKGLQKRGVSDSQLSAETDEIQPDMPDEFQLCQNVPNPFNPSTHIRFAIPGDEPARIELLIFDLRGRKIATLARGLFNPGWHDVVWDGKNSRGVPVGSGVYIYTLRVADMIFTKKMTLLR